MSSAAVAAGLSVGVRVVRGPHWKWDEQDDGAGHVGTVIEIGRPGSKTSPDKTVVVQWDSGNKTNYRVGYQGSYDLRLFDNASAGVKHPDTICDACKQQGIAGIRWKCLKCKDYDLCTPCYNSGEHSHEHPFTRFTTPNSKGVKVAKRAGAVTVEAKGIFPGAKVERGPAWEWGNQDGGDGKQGKVIDIRGWDSETERSVANILWHSGTANVYRLGHKGKADLKYRTAASGGMYYREHLPVLGEPTEQINPPAPCPFKVGNRVKVSLEPEVLKVMQEGHGGWNPRMAEYIGKVGTVHRITEKGDIRVQYEGCANRWTFHPDALTKVYSVGDAVMVINDLERVKELQRGHGEWTDCMTSVLGCIGKVVKVYSDGDMRVCIKGQTWTFNPMCCIPRPQDQMHVDNTTSAEDTPGCSKNASVTRNTSTGEEASTMLDQILSAAENDPANPESLVKEAVQGHIDIVKDIINRHPDQVNVKSTGKTALQVASHQGVKELVVLLLQANADVEIRDDDGDTALHYSAFGNQPEIMKILLKNGANINAVNNGGCSTLHVAVNKQHLDCVKVLLDHECDVNIQDTYGDTAQHDAIGKDNRDIVNLLTEHTDVDFTLKNNRGFNALHHAALKGNANATEKILMRFKDLVDKKKDDGFSALHLAALNGHIDVARVLLDVGEADINIKNNKAHTPIMLGITQGHLPVVQMLVESGATVNACNEEGDSPLHLALLQAAHNSSSNSSKDKPSSLSCNSQDGVSGESSENSAIQRTREILKCLLDNGADAMLKDSKGRTPADLAVDYPELLTIFEQFSPKKDEPTCIVCEEELAVVSFQPCGHKVTCADCCARMKKCISCQVPIDRKLLDDGSVVQTALLRPNSTSENVLKEMAQKLQEMEDTLVCNICLDRKRNVAFLCGHSACSECSAPLRQCHMCRKPITKRINLFLSYT